jgi:hypothetical protein
VGLTTPTARRWRSPRPFAIGLRRAGKFRQFIGKTVSIAGTLATGEELAAIFTAGLGEKVVYRPMTTDQMRTSAQLGVVEVLAFRCPTGRQIAENREEPVERRT